MSDLNAEKGVSANLIRRQAKFVNRKPSSLNSTRIVVTILIIGLAISATMLSDKLIQQWLLANETFADFVLIVVAFLGIVGAAVALMALNRYKKLYEKTFIEAEELKCVQKDLQASENRFYELFDNANDIIYTTDLSGNFTSLNKAGEQISGYSRDEFLKMHFAQVVAAEYLDIARRTSEFAEDKLGGTVYELQIITKDKRPVLIEVNTRFVKLDGNPIGIQGIARLTRKQEEKILRETEARFRAVTENSRDAIIIVDCQSQILFANTACEKQFGYKNSELVGQSITMLMPEPLRELHLRGFQRYLETNVKKLNWNSIEVVGLKNDQSEFPFEIAFSEFEIKSERFFSGTIRDLTERKQAEQALRKSEEQFRSLYENAPLGIYRSTPDGRILMANPAILRMINFTLEEVLAQNFNEKTVEAKSKRRWFQEKIEREGEIKGYETIWLRRDGTPVFVRENARCVRAPDNTVLYYEGTVEDISGRRQLEEQLRQAQKMEAVGQLAGGVAHDFNNILTIITGYSDLTLRRLPLDDPLRRNVQEVIKAGDRATTLTKQLLAFSRKQILAPKILNLNAVVADMNEMLRRLIGEDIDFVSILDPELGSIEADRGQIEQVLLNLVVNARDAMPNGGQLIMQTAIVNNEEVFTQIEKVNQPEQFVMLTISDSGVGIDAATRERIFEPFFTTKESGTGLGLSTTYGIVKQSGGQIKVFSEKGAGTTFKIYFPLVFNKARGFVVPATEKSAFLGGMETILLVEDEEPVRELIKNVLQSNGYQVLAAETPSVALAICESHQQTIQLVLTDVIMPQMNGQELVQKAIKLHPEMKILYMSGYTNTGIVEQGILAEKTNFIQKPFEPKALGLKVRETLDAKV